LFESCAQPRKRYEHHAFDIRDRQRMRELLKSLRPHFIIHSAGQSSHDLAASIPYDDFDVNAVGTLNLLVAARDYRADSPICFTSIPPGFRRS
jgi:CDP-paratose 2-epimerase